MAAAIRGRRVFAAEALAIGSAASIAASAMLVDSLRGRVGLVRLTRWQLTAAFAMSASLSLAIGGWRTLEPWSLGLLLASGFFGIAVASTTYYAAIFAIGPRLTALLFSLASPFALALGYVFLGETISSTQGAGVALVLAGVALAVGGGRGAALASAGRARLWGIGLGVVTALGQALGGLLARPAMQAGVEPITAMAARSGLAAL
ncbi:MAG: DMT family transporter, partial [Methylobacteriaceae bacterium]|nr:DMT family transporter [Methylobacteriaceae bacterium]